MPSGRGRPRQFPPGTNATDRKALARRQLKAAGGHSLEVELGPIAWQALQKMAPRGKRGPFVEKLILAKLRRRAAE